MPPKGQELDDHYFGTIRERQAGYMKDLNIELWKLGILSKTQHNEVAVSYTHLSTITSVAGWLVPRANGDIAVSMISHPASTAFR